MQPTSLIRWVLWKSQHAANQPDKVGSGESQHAANQPDKVGSGEVTACCPPA